MRSKDIYVFYFLLLLSDIVFAQPNTSVRLLTRPAERDSIILRWAPADKQTWDLGNNYGYLIHRYTMLRNDFPLDNKEYRLLSDSPVKPEPLHIWAQYQDANKYVNIAAECIFGKSEIFALSPVAIANKYKEEQTRFSFALYAADNSLLVAKLSGLYFVDKTARPDEKYLYIVHIAAPDSIKTDTALAFTGISEYQPLPKPIDLTAKWSDRSVLLSWNIKYLNHIYNSYIVEKSTDGKHYELISENASVQAADEGITPEWGYRSDSLPDNKTKFYYRIRGINAFGEVGSASDSVVGQGYLLLSIAPIIKSKEVIENNKVKLIWDFPEDMNKYINGFRVYRSTKPQGTKQKVYETKKTTERSFTDKNPELTNYYILSAYNNETEKLSTGLIYAELIDSVPPLAPVGLAGSVDSLGTVRISWKANTEKDIYGYRIYRSNRPEFEFLLAYPSEILDTNLTDTVNIKTLTKEIYYRYHVELYNGNTMLQEQNCTSSCTFSGLSGEYENGGKIYKLLIYDNKNCSLETQVKVQEPQTKLTLISEIISPVSCYGKSDAAFNIIASGGWDNKYRYSADSIEWISVEPIFTAMGAGDYKYFVRDGIGGTASVTVTITQPAPLKIDPLKVIPVTCYNTATGEILLRLSGGTYPYTFINSQNIIKEIIDKKDTLASVRGLLAGNYNFRLKDNYNCIAEISGINVTQPELLRITATDIIQPTCGNDNGKLTVRGTGGATPYTFRFINNISNSILQTKTSSNTATFENIANGTYRLVIIDNNGCTGNSDILTFNNYVMPVVIDATKTDARCYAESSGQVLSAAQEGTARIVYFTLINTQDSVERRNENGIFENIYAGNYLIYAYDTNGCLSNPYPMEINQPDSLTVNIRNVADVINKGTNDGQITFSVFGGNSGKLCTWLQNENGQATDSMFVITGSTNTFNAFAGAYTLKASDTKGCIFMTDTLQVVEPEIELHVTVLETLDAPCKSQTGKITVEGAGGWGGYSYKYADNEQFSSLNSFGNLLSGTYHITVIDRMGATASKYITVNEPQDSLKTEIIAIQNPTCGNNNGELSMNIFGGTVPYRIFAQNDTDTLHIDSAQTVILKNAGTGAMLIHALDANGCKFEQETIIPEDSLLKIEKIESAENSLTAIISGGTSPYSYMWKRTDGDETFEDTPQIEYIPDGIYRLTVTDSNGCTAEERVVFYSNNPLTLKAIQKRDETSLNAKNGYAVLYSAEGLSRFDIIKPNDSIISYNSAQTTSDFKVINDTVYLSNLEGGKWIIKGVSKNGRIAIAEFEILPYKKFEFGKTEIINVSTSDSIDGFVHIDVTGGGGENIFIWTDKSGNNVQSINAEYSTTLYNVSAGVYTVTVTDKYGNMLSTEIKILAPDLPLRISVYEQKDQTCMCWIHLCTWILEVFIIHILRILEMII